MGELLSKDMIADLVINLINIVILFLVTKALVYKPVKKFLEARRQRLEDEAARAKAGQAEADAAREQYEALLAGAEEMRRKSVAEAQNAARAESERILAGAREQAEQVKREAAAAAELTRADAVQEAKKDIVEMAVTLSEKILGRAVTEADTLRAAEQFFEETNV